MQFLELFNMDHPSREPREKSRNARARGNGPVSNEERIQGLDELREKFNRSESAVQGIIQNNFECNENEAVRKEVFNEKFLRYCASKRTIMHRTDRENFKKRFFFFLAKVYVFSRGALEDYQGSVRRDLESQCREGKLESRMSLLNAYWEAVER